MEIIEVVELFGTDALLVVGAAALLCLILYFILNEDFSSAGIPPFVGFVAFCGMALVVAFKPTEITYHAVVTDYDEVQENGYVIVEKLENDIYVLKAKDQVTQKGVN